MPHDDLSWLDGYLTAALIRSGEISPLDAVDAALAQLDKTEPHINAFVTVLAEQARDAARSAGEVLAHTTDRSELGALFGVPISIKDLVDTAGVRTTYGAKEYTSNVPGRDGVNAARLRAAGAILIGKTTTPEFGMLGTTESGLTGITRNPWNGDFIAGGSSGGAAASVAAGVGALAWASDGGGSIRIPASACGVVGLKASRGRIPNDALWESAGVEGPITRSVVDSALLLQVTAGPSGGDPFSLPSSDIDFVDAVLHPRPLAGIRIAYAPQPSGGAVAREVLAAVEAVVRLLESHGAHVDVIDLPLPDPVSYFLAFWGVGLVHSLDELGIDFPHPGTRDLIARAPGAEEFYHASTVTRGEIWRTYAAVFAEYDYIITPTMPVAPFRHPGDLGGNADVDGVPVDVPVIDFHRLTESPSHAGLPAITVPAGRSAEGLPIGLQIVGSAFDDAGVLSLAAQIERVQPWAATRPTIA
jgi:Asp-tRNA(Asn)/Glu-tRNA(Gln) amidotransferase A subunit family amidase